MAKSPELTEGLMELVGARFRALGEPSRLKLLRVLLDGERTVGELAERTGLGQANTSRHLQALTEVGILGRRRSGTSVIYFVADESIRPLCDLVCNSVYERHLAQGRLLKGGK